jgi:formiminotetrahydrofolate cyclodeaminase
MPFLVKHGNQYLISDIIVAADMLLAAFNSARVNVEVNS